jgi:hypothetical protein
MSNEFPQTHRIEPTLPEADVTGLDTPVTTTPSSGASVPSYTTTPSSSSSSSSTTEAAKDATKQVGSQAADSGRQVAQTAKDEARGVASEAKSQARDLAGEARTQLRSQASTQQNNLAGWLSSMSDELRGMADRSGEPGQGVATSLVHRASSRSGDLADWLQRHEPEDILDEVSRFARRRPGLFLAIAAAAGLVAGRLARSLAAGNDSDEGGNYRGYESSRYQSSLGYESAGGYGTTAGYGTAGGYESSSTWSAPSGESVGATYEGAGSAGYDADYRPVTQQSDVDELTTTPYPEGGR